jgi:hypothetical protein
MKIGVLPFLDALFNWRWNCSKIPLGIQIFVSILDHFKNSKNMSLKRVDSSSKLQKTACQILFSRRDMEFVLIEEYDGSPCRLKPEKCFKNKNCAISFSFQRGMPLTRSIYFWPILLSNRVMFVCTDDLGNEWFKPRTLKLKLYGRSIEDERHHFYGGYHSKKFPRPRRDVKGLVITNTPISYKKRNKKCDQKWGPVKNMKKGVN